MAQRRSVNGAAPPVLPQSSSGIAGASASFCIHCSARRSLRRRSRSTLERRIAWYHSSSRHRCSVSRPVNGVVPIKYASACSPVECHSSDRSVATSISGPSDASPRPAKTIGNLLPLGLPSRRKPRIHHRCVVVSAAPSSALAPGENPNRFQSPLRDRQSRRTGRLHGTRHSAPMAAAILHSLVERGEGPGFGQRPCATISLASMAA